MTDEFDKLRKALKAAPAVDPATKAATLARAMENFDVIQTQRQETTSEPRPMSDRPEAAGFLTGVRTMLNSLARRPALAASVSIAAVCVGVLTVGPVLWQRPALPVDGSAPQQSQEAIAPNQVDQGLAKPKAAPTPKAEEPLAAADLKADTLADETANSTVAPTASPAPTPKSSESRLAAAPAESADAQAEGAVALEVDGIAKSRAIAPLTLGEAESFDAALARPSSEAYANADANPVKIVADEPVSTFSIDVDTASYAVVRSSLTGGMLPPADAVRVEEMVNYFPYDYPAPAAGEAPFRTSVSLFQTPWNKDTELLRIGLQGRLPALADRPPLNLVFLIDTSGSMDEPNKLPLLQQSFRLMLAQLRAEDRVAIVTYAGSAGEVLAPTAAGEKDKILGALGQLAAGGSTAGQEGLMQAYQVAERMKSEGSVTRILLATDGDFNVGISDPEELKAFVAKERESGTYLSVLGFGRGNLDDETMQALAQNGNGTAAYIDTLSEAQKVLVDQLTGALFPIADDVKIQVEFNPAVVAEYRLIGYETRVLNREDFNNDRVDAGEIGAGRQVTALYEVTPVGSPAQLSDPLRYGKPSVATADGGEVGFLKLRYKAPGAAGSQLIEVPIAGKVGEADADGRFAAAIAGFGQLLEGSTYLKDWGWADAIDLANGAKGVDPYGYRAEAVQLMRLAQSLSR
jgi:Ca-activated chloride channel family protein